MPRIIPMQMFEDHPQAVSQMCNESSEPIFVTRDNKCELVIMSMEHFDALTDDVEIRLDEADRAAEAADLRYTEDEVFARLRGRIYGQEAV